MLHLHVSKVYQLVSKVYQLIHQSILLRNVGKLELGLKSNGAPGPVHSLIFLSFNHLSGSYLCIIVFLLIF